MRKNYYLNQEANVETCSNSIILEAEGLLVRENYDEGMQSVRKLRFSSFSSNHEFRKLVRMQRTLMTYVLELFLQAFSEHSLSF